ncbi:hypothetical protein J2T10_001969 [Paenarthrobacter nicotinovorans]|uniref:Uncharacterized protein n=1 Tax=Paenarthrobacter nicotinovorans TaxID=29320 RepID=A0ABT9TKZ3_PAENI|nr:hypothetical protein [Paenarthrobacter nicotinovorans]MDQ0102323.1 hypothetical protein [Paenarthrobacter nicotinovorans]
MSKIKEEGLVSVSIHAGQLVNTGHGNDDTHQFRMGHTNFIHFTPEAAQQWINTLTSIAKEAQ